MTLPFRKTEGAEALALKDAESEFENAAPEFDANGDVDWTSVLRENEPWLRAVIAKRVGESAAVDEVFQEVALAVASQKSPLRDPSKVGAWLYRTAVLQSALYRRTAARKRNLHKKYESEDAANPNGLVAPDPLDWLVRKEREELVRDAAAQLPLDEQRMLGMKYGEDKSYQEIADELKTTALAVQSKLHRARKRLKEILNQKVSDL